MQGRLVAQDPNDRPVDELLRIADADKKRRMKTGRLKEPMPPLPLKSGELPYALPAGWKWVRLGAVAEYNGRDNADPKDIDKGVGYLT